MSVARVRGQIEEGRPFRVRAFLPLLDGTRIMQADVTSWALRIYDLSSSTPGTTIYELTAQAASSLINNTLQSWEHDDIGYNLLDTVSLARADDTARTFAPEGLHVYKLEYKLTMVSASENPAKLTAIAECVSTETD